MWENAEDSAIDGKDNDIWDGIGRGDWKAEGAHAGSLAAYAQASRDSTCSVGKSLVVGVSMP